MKLTNLKDLRFVMKEMEAAEEKPEAGATNQGASASKPTSSNRPRPKTVTHLSKAEEHARNEGLVRGQRVRMMDTNDTATIDFAILDGYRTGLRHNPEGNLAPFQREFAL